MPNPEHPHYTLQIAKSEQKVLERLPKDLLQRIRRTVNRLADEPRPVGCKKLAGFDNYFRIRVGDWRITYAIFDDVLIVLVVEVAPRGDAYRHL
ncbi:MAG: type II toxin-antitoxin system RelE/ParE family toxin [Caldilineaceae bacterium]|nr:type II toxin-antitoxin system RelE/ParE family toxin [Caldilineaceae bacterium]